MKKITLIFLIQLFPAFILSAGRTDAGLTLLEDSAARPAALGGAFSAATDDVAAMTYNPASLGTLKSGQASFLFQRGIDEDSFGQLLFGSPIKKFGVGVSVGYFDSGTVRIFDGVNERDVTGQSDFTVGLGVSHQILGAAVGVTGKYIASELAERDTANAYAFDAGLSASILTRVQIGFAVQNVGSKIKFNQEGEDLPRIARAGFSYLLFPTSIPTQLFFDAPYYINQEQVRPAMGVETSIGPLALRAGYRNGSDLEEFSFGTGFLFGPASVDYSFGMVEQLDSRHRFSMTIRFGNQNSK